MAYMTDEITDESRDKFFAKIDAVTEWSQKKYGDDTKARKNEKKIEHKEKYIIDIEEK